MPAISLPRSMLGESMILMKDRGKSAGPISLRGVAQSVNRYGTPRCYDALTRAVSSVTFTYADWQTRSIYHTPFYCDRLTFGRNLLQKSQDRRRVQQQVLNQKADVRPHGLRGCSPNGVPSPQQAMTDPWGPHDGAEHDRSGMRRWLGPIRLEQADGRIGE